MQTYEIPELGTVHRLEAGDDASGVLALLESDAPVAFDTEGSGLNIYAAGWELRLCQFGSADTAYVWEPADFPDLVRTVVTTRPVWYWNADFDTRVLDQALGITLEDTAPYVMDAAIFSRLIDSREKSRGGIGHGLKDQATELLGLDVADARKKVMEAGRAYKLKREADVWAQIPTTDETYVTYAGQDVLLTSALGPMLEREAAALDLAEIASFEHSLAYCISTLIRKGWQIDREYAERAVVKFDTAYHEAEKKLAGLGVEPTKTGNYYSSKGSLTARFTELGVRFSEFTPTGAVKLDDDVLQKIAAKDDEAAEIARTVLDAKAAQKSEAFVKGFLEAADPQDRVHSTINPLGTVTGRMSSSGPNLQNLTRDVEEIRGCFVAEQHEPEPHVLISVDFSGVEWRVAAGVTGDRNMKHVFSVGGDIHAMVAEIVFGKGYTKHNRTQCKSVGLGRLYGGGVATLARQSGLPLDKVQEAVDAIDQLYPGIRETVRQAYEEINGPTALRIATGRVVTADSAHLALNYKCQGPARDLLAYAVVRLFEAGYGPFMLMLVHDEALFSVPARLAERMLAEIKALMECDFLGVRIEAEGEILGPRWKK